MASGLSPGTVVRRAIHQLRPEPWLLRLPHQPNGLRNLFLPNPRSILLSPRSLLFGPRSYRSPRCFLGPRCAYAMQLAAQPMK